MQPYDLGSHPVTLNSIAELLPPKTLVMVLKRKAIFLKKKKIDRIFRKLSLARYTRERTYKLVRRNRQYHRENRHDIGRHKLWFVEKKNNC